jgi:hypothetical protein
MTTEMRSLGYVAPVGVTSLGYVAGVIVGLYIGGCTNSAYEGLPFVGGLIGAFRALMWHLGTQRQR